MTVTRWCAPALVLGRLLPIAGLLSACGGAGHGSGRTPPTPEEQDEEEEGVAGAPRDDTVFDFEPEPDDPSGPILLDGVTGVPDELAARLAPYLAARQTRLAAVAGSDGPIFVITRLGSTAQVYRVARPLAPPTRLTAEADPIQQAAYLSSPPALILRLDNDGDEQFQIVRLDLTSRQRTLLSDGSSRHGAFAVAPDGELVAYTSNARNPADMDLYVRDVLGRTRARRLLAGGGQWLASSFTPAGDEIIVREYRSSKDSAIHMLELDARRLTRIAPSARRWADLSARQGADGRVYFTSDRGGQYVELYQWSPGDAEPVSLTRAIPWDIEILTLAGSTIAFAANEGGASATYVRDLATGRTTLLDELPRGVVSELALMGGGTTLFVSLATATEPRDVYAVDLPSGRVERWTRSSVPSRALIEPESVRIPSFDGLEVPGFLFRPRGPGPHPVLLWLHGGPESQFRPGFHPIIQYLAAESGIAVLAPNVRGSRGYGRTYLALDDGRRRGDAIRDVGAALDWVARDPGLDAGRVGVYGASYGGFLTLAALVEYNDRLAAGCEAVGISDLVTFLEGTSVYRRDQRRAEYGDERQPEMRAYLESVSPLGEADRISRPLFVAHGANDPRVPLGQAEQIAAAVRGNGGEVWTMVAPDEGHGFRRRRTRDAFYLHLVAFFERHLASRGDRQAPAAVPTP